MAMNKNYGMGGRDSAPSPKMKDKGTPDYGLTSLENIRSDVHEVTEQSRYAGGSRNESLPGGYKLTQ